MQARFLAILACVGAAACSNARVQPPSATAAVGAGAPEIVVVAERYTHDAPAKSDAAPRFRLAFRYADGTELPIAGEAHAHVPFRSGVALIEASAERPLVLVSPDGARRVLALRSASEPARAEDGALYYGARYGLEVELHRLTASGEDHVLARGLSSAGVLAPRADGSVLFVGAINGGVAGMWRASQAEGARCLTNCALRTGQDWQGAFVPPPGNVDQLHAAYDALRVIDGDAPALGDAP